MSAENNETHAAGTSSYPWAGPAFFVLVLIALSAFFVWFLRA
jgi:hypothetical protein